MNYKKGVFGVLNIDGLSHPPLVLLDGGIEKRQQEFYDFYNDKRPDYSGYLFQYTLKGQGHFTYEGTDFTVSEEMGFLVRFPEDSHYYLPSTQSEAWEFLYFHFDGDAAGSFVEKIKANCGSVFSLSLNSAAIRMALQMQNRLAGGGRLQKYEGGEFVYRFLRALLSALESPAARQKNSLSELSIAIMETEYGTLTGIDELAERLHISPAHFSRIFHQETGMAPVYYLTQVRLQAAINDLLNTRDPLDLVAQRNGFSCGNYFCKVFRKNLGITPTEYRRIYKGGH